MRIMKKHNSHVSGLPSKVEQYLTSDRAQAFVAFVVHALTMYISSSWQTSSFCVNGRARRLSVCSRPERKGAWQIVPEQCLSSLTCHIFSTFIIDKLLTVESGADLDLC